MAQTDLQQRQQYIATISKMSTPALKILAELSQRPGAEKKLIEKAPLVKAFL